ncbi:MAG: 50S ribosomal protein L5, partial [Patescibacteria group bacterium]
MERLLTHYRTVVVPALKKEGGFRNTMATPRIIKVVIGAGVGKRIKEAEHAERVAKMLARITGQKPAPRAARLSIAGF